LAQVTTEREVFWSSATDMVHDVVTMASSFTPLRHTTWRLLYVKAVGAAFPGPIPLRRMILDYLGCARSVQVDASNAPLLAVLYKDAQGFNAVLEEDSDSDEKSSRALEFALHCVRSFTPKDTIYAGSYLRPGIYRPSVYSYGLEPLHHNGFQWLCLTCDGHFFVVKESRSKCGGQSTYLKGAGRIEHLKEHVDPKTDRPGRWELDVVGNFVMTTGGAVDDALRLDDAPSAAAIEESLLASLLRCHAKANTDFTSAISEVVDIELHGAYAQFTISAHEYECISDRTYSRSNFAPAKCMEVFAANRLRDALVFEKEDIPIGATGDWRNSNFPFNYE